jgi:tRNA A37 threonylcarbamoyladenosine biosynthesis protein TsaE
MPRGTVSWRDVYRMYDEKQIDADKAATMMQEIRVKEWQEFEEKFNGNAS